MKDKDLAVQNYKRFCELEGSDYIASEFALETILRLIKIFNVNSILELGLGIGSISDTVLQYAKKANHSIDYVGTEKNEFCLNVLKTNVLEFEKIELHTELNQIKNNKFDLIIIDGYDDTLSGIVGFCKKIQLYLSKEIEKDKRKPLETFFQTINMLML